MTSPILGLAVLGPTPAVQRLPGSRPGANSLKGATLRARPMPVSRGAVSIEPSQRAQLMEPPFVRSWVWLVQSTAALRHQIRQERTPPLG